MFQLYPFRGNDYAQVYGQANGFLQQLNDVSGIEVKRDEVREDTKNYLDYDRAVTTVSVCVQFVDGLKAAQMAQVAKVAALYAELTRVVEDHSATESEADVPFDPFLDGDDLP